MHFRPLRAAAAALLFIFSSLAASLHAQVQTADKILAVVGKQRIILQSDLEQRVAQMRQQDPSFPDSSRCELLHQMMLEKLLVEQAERDSVLVTDEEVEGTLENKLRYFIGRYGSKERLEQVTGKTVYQIKDDNREAVREGMLVEKVQGSIMQHVRVTPSEVRQFFAQQNADSLPYFPATVELGQIVIVPAVSAEVDSYMRANILDIRRQIVEEGKSFEAMAGLYSADGSRDEGGDLGLHVRGDFVSEFSAAAWRLQPGQVSGIVKTQFGYHLIQMVERRGEQARLRHILFRPERSSADFRMAMSRLDSVRSQLVAGTLTFGEAVGKYSTDDMSKMTGGMILDPQTGSSRMAIEALDADLALMLDSLQPGAYSQPQIFTTQNGDRAARIVWMKGRTEPHRANLTDDYNRIQEVALAQKKNLRLEAWLAEKLPTYYVRIAPEYATCRQMARWTLSPK